MAAEEDLAEGLDSAVIWDPEFQSLCLVNEENKSECEDCDTRELGEGI